MVHAPRLFTNVCGPVRVLYQSLGRFGHMLTVNYTALQQDTNELVNDGIVALLTERFVTYINEGTFCKDVDAIAALLTERLVISSAKHL